MATVDVKNLEGKTVKALDLADEVFAVKPNQSLLWDAVKQYLANVKQALEDERRDM